MAFHTTKKKPEYSDLNINGIAIEFFFSWFIYKQ